jgi:ABC-type uncharacterized transport system substrate-binding protein
MMLCYNILFVWNDKVFFHRCSKPSIDATIALMGALLFPLCASAHPHSWIDLKTVIEGNPSEITGLKMVWEFDPMTTAYWFDGEDMSPKHKQETLAKLANETIENMLSTHYFTYFYDQKTPVRYKKVTHAKLTAAAGKATLSFQIALTKPITFNGHKLKLSVFDPTYYIDMSWAAKSAVTVDDSLKSHCSTILIEPHPTPAQVSYALAIPADSDPDDTLGQVFTQSVELVCQS